MKLTSIIQILFPFSHKQPATPPVTDKNLLWFKVQFDSGIAYNSQLDSVVTDIAEVEGERYP
jgi:hypothetical protein